MDVHMLRQELSNRNLDTKGSVGALLDRLKKSDTSHYHLSKMKAQDLKDELQRRGLESTGRKALLMQKVLKARSEAIVNMHPLSVATSHINMNTPLKQPATEKQNTLSPRKEEAKLMAPIPGTKHIKRILSAQEAAIEKILAGEKRNVEHIAELDQRQVKKKRRRTH
mmetsp:Transcript_3562/g.4794  ORF Transcript_3562/g.4794 Transcript_3562/m.4794 type:complete len:167 (+) Transcript_3562:63-563(+)|eukprot:CAMPEP_0204867562 /NCGR_PEP_ID=MMETSP1348-20121228/23238_1 /ASSEMBLY_ACC=CAM_ASM_000700 /TAXON_ID=215587 /ORGANISM="Aplanochytrium stocchinoi, Strain GSBS06" /LENGTH=166 /DNA_ID=CAMNT_0052020059 /DNA_START=45 /DNA_END=545 /DNA_ORIENTATION=+